MKLLFNPSVTSAVRSLESALVKLERAEASHNLKARDHAVAAIASEALASEEQANADRAFRIRTKLQDLLA